MLYNMINCKEFGDRKIVKAIVLENSRVEKVGADEIVVEVIKVVQQANWVGANRDKRGDQHKYKLDKDLKLDAEDMLGKVYDITVDKNDNIVEVKLDDTYKYLDGKITNVDFKKFGLNNTNYTALFDERYASEDERIFRTYLNDKDFTYEDFAEKYKKGQYDFARVTVKNGKVVFIDAFQFNDIAPVKEVKDEDVYYYDDMDFARVKRAANLGSRVIFNENGKFYVGERKLIAADDVIHFYAGYTKAVVKKDAKTEQKLEKTYQDRWKDEWLVLENKDEYKLDPRDYFRAVYSYEGKEFMVVKDRGSVNPIVGRKVKVLRALNGSVQLIQSDLPWNDGIQAIRQITSKGDVRLLPPTGKDFWSEEGRNTWYYDASSANNNLLFNDFRLNDIVFYRGEGKEGEDLVTSQMGLLFHKHQEVEGTKVNAGYADRLNKATITDRYITVTPDTDNKTKWQPLYNPENQPKNLGAYRYFNNLNAYYINSQGNLAQVGDMGKFIAANKGNTHLKAFVVSEYELKQMIEKRNNVKKAKYGDTYYYLSDSALANDVARLVVFDGEEIYEDTKTVYARVTSKVNYTNHVTFEDANGKEYNLPIWDGLDHKDFEVGDIVQLQIEKDTLDKEVQEGYFVKVVIHENNNNELYRIESLNYKNSYKVTKYIGGLVKETYFTPETNIFNNMPSGWAKIDFEDGVNFKFIRNILFVDEPTEPTMEKVWELGIKYTEIGQFEVIDKLNGRNKFYKINPNTRFYAAKEYVENGITKYKETHDYGWEKEPMKKFVEDYGSGDVVVRVNPDHPDFALEVLGIKTKAQVQRENLEKAKALLKEINAIYDKGTTDQAQKLMDALKAKLAENDLEGKVNVPRVETTTQANADGNGEMEVTLEATPDPVMTEKVKKSFHIETVKELNEKEAQRVLDLVKGKVLTVTANPVTPESVEKEVVAAIMRADSSITDIEHFTNNTPSKSYVVKATAKGDDWEVELTTTAKGAQAGSAKEVFTINK